MWLDLTRGRRMAGVPLFVCLARLHEPSVYMSAAWLHVAPRETLSGRKDTLRIPRFLIGDRSSYVREGASVGKIN